MLREVLIAPHPLLEKVSKPVDKIDQSILTLLSDMAETMYASEGVGLAAPQVAVNLRVIVVDTDYDPQDPSTRKIRKFVNPELTWVSDEDHTGPEGCLSIPQHYADVVRPKEIKVKYLDENSKVCELSADGLLSVCIQHEIDHLDGILFIDHLSNLKRNIIMRKLLKEKKHVE